MNMTGTVENFNLDNFNKLIEALKPKHIIYTSSKIVYDEMLKQPGMNKECIKLTNLVDGTYIVDVEKLNEINKKPYHFI